MSERRESPAESGPSPTPSSNLSFTVYVDDNFHVQEKDERCIAGTYATYAEALVVCKAIVDQWLTDNCAPGKWADELYAGYIGYGEDPFIVGPDTGAEHFSAWGYAKQRCAEMCPPKEEPPTAPNR
jgi:hypothetical protein